MSSNQVLRKDYKLPDFNIETVNLTFDLNEGFTLVTASLAIKKVADTKNVSLDGEELELISLKLNEKLLDEKSYALVANKLTLFNVPQEFDLTIVTKIYPEKNTALSGLYKSSGNYCTQCEAEGFRRITYYPDRPDVMARFTTTIIADKSKYPVLLSNGNFISKNVLDDGRVAATWQDPFKKPAYLFALVAGDLDCLDDEYTTKSGRKIKLQLFVEKGNLDKADHAINALKKAMLWDEEVYSREYDLDIYMIVAVSDFNMGAMENKGLNIFNTQYVLAKPETATDADYVNVEAVIGHEYFHNWSGNRVTLRDWFQLSLKEGLTVFREQSFTGDITSKTCTRIKDVNRLRTAQFSEDSSPLAHPVRPDSYVEINNFYTATVYEKGAEVIRMQKALLGDELFFKGMDLYFNRHDGQAVTIDDFVKCMEDAANYDLSQFKLWYSQSGTPEIHVEDHYDESQQKYSIKFKQVLKETPGQKNKKPFHIPVDFGLMSEDGNEILSKTLELKNIEENFTFENIDKNVVPSILRQFSAPVKVFYPYEDAKLLHLYKYDTDYFNRWEEGQKFAVNLILKLVNNIKTKKQLNFPAEYFETLKYQIETLQDDKLLLAEMLTLPSEKYIVEQMQIVDIDAIHEAREYVAKEVALNLQDILLEQYNLNTDYSKPYVYSTQEMGKRQWKNLCLNYLSLLDNSDLVHEAFNKAFNHNMTDAIAALNVISNSDAKYRQKVLDEFYDRWHGYDLVIDKWFAIQAVSKRQDALAKVMKLSKHQSFDIKNPNKVYSLIGAFTHSNLVRFHAADGSGYKFLSKMVIELDKINPQIAARMVKPLSSWTRYDEARQMLMQEALMEIAKVRNLSADVNELVSKSLNTERSIA